MRRRTKFVLAVVIALLVLVGVAFVLLAESAPELEIPQYGEPGPPPSVWPL